jgi:membrane protein
MRAMLGGRLGDLVRRTRVGRALLLMIDVLDQHNAPIAASAIAFDAFLSLVPLAAFAGMVLHRLHETDMIVRPLLRASPAPVADLISGAAERLSDDNAAVIAPISIAAFIWTTSSGLSTAMSVFEQMFHSPARPWWWRRGVAMVAIVATVAIVAAVTSVTVGIGMISAEAGKVAGVVVPTLTMVGMLSAFFRISVRRGPVYTRRRVLPGVLVTVVLWVITSALFSFYVSTLSRYATLYGGLAAVAIFLFWLWLLALALLVGGEVNAQLDGLRDEMAASRAASSKPATSQPGVRQPAAAGEGGAAP